MTSPAQIIYCPDLAAMLARATEYAAAGADLDATNLAADGTYQPEIIAYTPAATVVLRLHAMADGTHHLRRTHAFDAAAAIIAQARAAAHRHAATAPAIAQAIQSARPALPDLPDDSAAFSAPPALRRPVLILENPEA